MSVDSEAELSDLMQFLYACPIGLVGFDAEGAISLMNPKAMLLMQPLAPTTFVSNFFTALASCGPELRNLAQDFAPSRGTVCENHRVFVRGGSADDATDLKVLDCTLVKLSSQRFIATLADVSRQVAQERRLRQAEAWFSSLLDGAQDFDVLSLDADGRIDGVKSDFLQQTGLDRDAVVGSMLHVLDAPDPDDARPSAADQIALARRDGWYLDEGWQRLGDGGRRWCQRLIVVRSDDDAETDRVVTGYVAVLRSTTRRTFDTAKLQRLLRTDHLTGACNRARFFEIGEREARHVPLRRRPLSVIAIDVDHFKRINDTHGHAVGDEVLKALTRACQGVLGRDSVFARVGGEEFAALLSCDLQRTLDVAESLRAAIAGLAVPSPEGSLRVTASLGCAVLTSSTGSLAALLAEADKALYAAKRAGRDRVCAAGQVSAVA